MHDARDAQARRPRGPTRRGAVDLAGVDGCPGGWVLARAGSPRSRFTPRAMEATVHARFSELLRALPADCVVALDMPVGLLDAPAPGGRGCDRAARRLLGPRRASVFTPPTRPALGTGRGRAGATRTAPGLSRQAANLLPKIREVDAALTPGLQRRVHEAHPELAFRRLAGAPMAHGKRTPAGRHERRSALQRVFASLPPVEDLIARHGSRVLRPDDVLDAWALLHTAWRIATGRAARLPEAPERDPRGMDMAIWH